ncbi:hypothetical protein [Candidatus Viadribacter manganicus]|uniref:DUF4359 domain-containing protein n=1 Tax=Candidatus Viadribacter manganicus TaxID=1759059 RepID=A0A1B1AF78_9PROT|nr:hypothetical protein [Candidatus Viadribacter manganicus]ANP45223.1 hypothetical protein ATE48_04465 [Candidatus Viadribacter manganicus]
MRLLLLLIIIGAAAYFTVPVRDAHEEAAQAFLQTQTQEETGEVQAQTGISLDGVVDFVTGMMAGQGRYETLYLASKYTLDMPGAAYLECWGAFTIVQCRRVDRASGQG